MDEGEGEGEHDGEGTGEAEEQRGLEVESRGEAQDKGHVRGDRQEGSVRSSPEKEVNVRQMESEGKETQSEKIGRRIVTSHRREVVAWGSAEDDNHYPDDENENEEPYQAKMHSRLLDEPKNNDVVRRVFGDSDEEEEEEYGAQNEQRSSVDVDGIGYGKDLRAEYRVPDEDAKYESEDKYHRQKLKNKPIGPPLQLEVPLHRPPGQSERMSMIKVSNIMGIEPKPFDPKLYVEEKLYVTDENGKKKHMRLKDNVVRWREVKNNDGSTSIESNARFVKWSDGSTQLLIGDEVLDINVLEDHHDQTHLFLHHGKGILQSQGKISTKMRFMPSSITSRSHRSLTAIVDSCHKKVSKVKNCITDFDPEKEKEEKEKVEHKTIRANEILHRKREKVNSKYTRTFRRERLLSPGFLEDDPEGEDEPNDYYSLHRSLARYRFEEDSEVQAEKCIINNKMNVPCKASLPAVRSSTRPVDSERKKGKLEYGIDAMSIERSVSHERGHLPKNEDECEDEKEYEEAADTKSVSEEEEEEPKQKKESGGSSLKHKVIESDEDLPLRKTVTHRRKAVVFDSDED